MLVPNVITLLALCGGVDSYSALASEGRFELGAWRRSCSRPFSTGMDGRVARMIKGQSKFGAELDSLADFVNFGVTPAPDALFLAIACFEQCRLDRGNDPVRDLRRACVWRGSTWRLTDPGQTRFCRQLILPANADSCRRDHAFCCQFMLAFARLSLSVSALADSRHLHALLIALSDGVAIAGVLGQESRASGCGAK
jgi:hypothetical protein